MLSSRLRVSIISPSASDADSGGGRTARRWQRFLARRFATSVAPAWPGDGETVAPDLLIAMHASRSADSLARFADAYGSRPSILVLTGSDLYRDLAIDAGARLSAEHATKLVVLQPEAIAALSAGMRAKTEVIVPSAPTLARRSPDPRGFELVMVGHLDDDKDPATAWRAFERVSRRDRSVRLTHIGEAGDARYREEADALAARNPGYRWLGTLSHALTRQQIRRARALLVPSLIEGGANVVIEAITSGVPVLASAIPGNIGLLGRGYAGTFPAGDDGALTALIERFRREPAFVALLTQQCAERAPMFAPKREQERWVTLVDACLGDA